MTKLTPQELDERIDKTLDAIFTASTKTRAEDSLKQLIRDCIEAVTPEKKTEVIFSQEWTEGCNDTIDTIQANTKELLG